MQWGLIWEPGFMPDFLISASSGMQFSSLPGNYVHII